MDDRDGDEYFIALEVPPAYMDRLWASGWRHFGWYFFRYRTSWHDGKRYSVIPLRIDLARFEVSKSQKRVLARNDDLEVVVRDAFVDAAKRRLFAEHSVRFERDRPSGLENFLSPEPSTVPCTNREIAVYAGDRLVGVTFLDVGARATSAVYAIHDPMESKRSLGIFMMLESIRYSRQLGCRYYYHGYAYREPFAYDYKKRFSALYYYDWELGWRPYSEID
jgi:leucyl-tRNA---protein transferase